MRARPAVAPGASVTVRSAYPDDAEALQRLALLGSACVPNKPLLLAELDGRLVAATSLSATATIADPLAPSAELLELLELRAGQLRAAARTR